MATEVTRMLSAQELVHLRGKVEKTLPIKGTKEFQPTNSWLEKKQIQTALDERKFLLEEERVERLGSLTKADWNPELKVANVTCRVGRQWKQMGHEVGGKLLLFPEEALFLLETNWLELKYNGVAMSIQQGYSMLLGPETGCTFNEYQAYLHLVRQGYTLLRHSKSIRATRYERQIRLHQHSVGQKQRKKNDGDIMEEVFVEDVIKNTEGQSSVAHTSDINRNHDSVKEEQEIIDVETVEIVDNLVPDRSGFTNTHQKQGMGENSRLSLQNGNFKCITKSQNCSKIVSAGKEDTKMRVHRKSDEKVSYIKVGHVASEIGSKIQSSTGSILKDKEKDGSVGIHTKEGEFEVTEPLSGTGVIVIQESESAVNGTDLSVEKNRKCNLIELHEKNVAGGLNNVATEGGILTECEVDVEQSRTSPASTETVRESGVDSVSEGSGSQYMQSSKEKNCSKNTSVSLTEVSKSVEHEYLKSDVTDIVFVDDSSASLDSNEKETVTSQKLSVQCSDIVDISDSSQISQPDLTVRINSRNTEKKASSEINNDIELVNVVETRENLDDEIVEINQNEMPSTSAFKSSARSKRKNSRRNTVNSAVKNEVIRNNTVTVKQDAFDIMEVEAFTANGTQSSGVRQNERRRSKVVGPPGGRKVTSIQLKHDEVEITPNIIDISEDERKYDRRCLTKKEVKSADYSEIEVVNLEDEEVKPEPSQEDERMQILDSIPSIEGKFVIHVSVPDKRLLPPNVCPQKKDYYIQRWRLTAPNIGGKPESDYSNNRDRLRRDEQPFHVGGQINPWIQYPAYLGGGGAVGAPGVWNNNTFPLSGPFMNQHYQNEFSGAFAIQSVFNRAAAMLSALGNSAFTHGGMFGMSPALSFPHTRNQYNTPYPWHYQTRPYYRRPYYKRRYPYRRYERNQYNSTSVGLGEQNHGTQTNDNTNVISLKVEENIKETKVKVPIKEDVVDEDVDVIECVSSSSSVKIDNDTMEWNSLQCPQSSSNTNEPEMDSMGKRQKRRSSGNLRFFNPPKKLKGFMEKLRSDSLEESRKNIYLKEEAEISKPNPEVLLQEDIPATDVKTWRDLKTVLQVVVLDSSSEDEENDDDDDDIYVVDDVQEPQIESNLPLVQPEDCRDIGSVLKKLQIIKPVNTEQEKSRVTNERLRISFDLYMPSTSFRKASPGLPNYRISVVGYQDPIPEPREVIALLRDFEDDVPLLFAIVLPDTVTFFQFGSVQLPVDSFCL